MRLLVVVVVVIVRRHGLAVLGLLGLVRNERLFLGVVIIHENILRPVVTAHYLCCHVCLHFGLVDLFDSHAGEAAADGDEEQSTGHKQTREDNSHNSEGTLGACLGNEHAGNAETG